MSLSGTLNCRCNAGAVSRSDRVRGADTAEAGNRLGGVVSIGGAYRDSPQSVADRSGRGRGHGIFRTKAGLAPRTRCIAFDPSMEPAVDDVAPNERDGPMP